MHFCVQKCKEPVDMEKLIRVCCTSNHVNLLIYNWGNLHLFFFQKINKTSTSTVLKEVLHKTIDTLAKQQLYNHYIYICFYIFKENKLKVFSLLILSGGSHFASQPSSGLLGLQLNFSRWGTCVLVSWPSLLVGNENTNCPNLPIVPDRMTKWAEHNLAGNILNWAKFGSGFGKLASMILQFLLSLYQGSPAY